MTYTSEEIQQLILYVRETQQLNEDLQAKMIMMNAKLENEEKKVKRLELQVKLLLYEKNYGNPTA